MARMANLTQEQIQRYYEFRLGERIRRKRGDGADCCCPFHDDKNPSLSVNFATGLWYCHAGCGSGNIFQFEQKLNGGTAKEARARVVAAIGFASLRVVKRTYHYPGYRQVIKEYYSCAETCGCELEGKEHRFERKTFWERRTASGTWVAGLEGVKRVPYMSDELLAHKGQGVCAVESLEDVNILTAMGFRSVCLKDPWTREWFEKYFGQEKVNLTVLPDKDESGLSQASGFALKAVQGGAFRSVRWTEPPDQWPARFDATKAVRILHWTKSDFVRLFDSAIVWSESEHMKDLNEKGQVPVKPEEETAQGSKADKLVALVLASGAELFYDQFSDPWACVPVRERREVVKIRSQFFQRWLAGLYWKACAKAMPSESLRAAISVLESRALFEGNRHDLHVRIAWYKGALWYDLNPRAVRIDAEGWKIVDQPPILFRRYPGQRQQCLPERGGKITKILGLVNLPGEKLHGLRLLFIVQLVASCVPDIPRPVFAVTGTKGSGKTTLGRVVQRIIDPTEMDVLAFPDSVREFIQTLAHHYFVVFDNMGRLPKWGPDALSRGVTGTGFSKRALFSDDDDILYSFKRSIAITSIWGVAQSPDLVDRYVSYDLPDLETHEDEASFWSRFEAEKPRLLGALFGMLSEAMRLKGESAPLPVRARMADFASWGVPITQALGVEPSEFFDALAANSRTGHDEAIQSSPVGICLVEFLKSRPSGWEGTPTELLKELRSVAPSAGVEDKSLPRDAGWVSRSLKDIAKDLPVYAWSVRFEHSGDRRVIFSPCNGSENGVQGVPGVQNEPRGNGGSCLEPESYGHDLASDSMDANFSLLDNPNGASRPVTSQDDVSKGPPDGVQGVLGVQGREEGSTPDLFTSEDEVTGDELI